MQAIPRGRIAATDYARTVALLGMAVYHFTYDLTVFGALPPGMASQGVWREFARLVAGSFLALSGVSLFLAHGQGLRLRPFLRRLALVGLAAGAVSLATWVMMPDFFVFFGILHSIAVSSVIGLAFLRAPGVVTLLAAALFLALPAVFRAYGLSPDWPVWLGLSDLNRPTMDFEPVFPWTGVFLTGLGAAQLTARLGGLNTLCRWRLRGGRVHAAMAWPGRHSLAIYLIHQPVLFGAVYVWANFIR